jgi:hypothetical protein
MTRSVLACKVFEEMHMRTVLACKVFEEMHMRTVPSPDWGFAFLSNNSIFHFTIVAPFSLSGFKCLVRTKYDLSYHQGPKEGDS